MENNKNGNAFIVSILFIALIIIILVFACAAFIGEVNSIAYNIKLDMYSFNRSAIIAVNKASTSRGSFNYSSKAYKEYFTNLVRVNYGLDDNMSNENGIIKSARIKEYEVLKKGTKDSYTNKKHGDMVLHSVIEVEIKPIFNIDVLKNICTFEIHEDVILNELIV